MRRYESVDAEVAASSAAGPFVWDVGNERHTLIASSETEFLWHALTLAPAPTAQIRFLRCIFRQ
jgi:hypothetical protein